MGKIININNKDNKNYERNRKILEEAFKQLEGKDVSGFVFSVETSDGQAAFNCVVNDSVLSFTQGYLTHLFLDTAYNHLENAENLDIDD